MTRRFIFLASVVCLTLAYAFPKTASAIPILQLYIEGANYNSATESWEFVANSPGDNTFRLWVIGNVAGPGGKGTIKDVRIAASFDSNFPAPGISLTPTTAGGVGVFNGFTDPSASAIPIEQSVIQTSKGVFNGNIVTNGGTPVLGDGKALPAHGIYGDDTAWMEFYLGDFTLSDSPIGDFINNIPSPSTNPVGQINAYDITITSPQIVSVHFDAYDHVTSNNRSKFSPFSHDADGSGGGTTNNEDPPAVPEPSTFLTALGLLISCGLGKCLYRRKSHVSRGNAP